jgi:hypothetical protein
MGLVYFRELYLVLAACYPVTWWVQTCEQQLPWSSSGSMTPNTLQGVPGRTVFQRLFLAMLETSLQYDTQGEVFLEVLSFSYVSISNNTPNSYFIYLPSTLCNLTINSVAN